jgi:N-acetylneuraminic acid mutarotase
LIIGGLIGNSSIDTIRQITASSRVIGHLPQPTHDAAAAVLNGSVYLFGGGSTVSAPTVVRIDPASGAAVNVAPLIEPLSDLGAVAIGGRAYLVGGYTGSEFATAILRYSPSGAQTVVARLPQGTRYAGVASIGRTIYVAGGLTPSGTSRAIYAFPLGGKLRKIGTLPKPQAHAALAAVGGTLYYVGGRTIRAINPLTGKSTVAFHLPASLSDPSVVGSERSVFIAGGGTNGIWLFTPHYPAPVSTSSS